MRSISFISIVLVLGLLVGCGTRTSPLAGGNTGNQAAQPPSRAVATAVGSVVGGISGHEIGRSLDAADRRAAMTAEYRALEFGAGGKATPWRNPATGHHGSVMANKPYVSGNQYCRTYTHTINIGGQPRTMQGRACRGPDGTWRNVG